MASHRAVLLTPPSSLAQPTEWSYLHIGTKPPLKSFACHSYENCRGVGEFFPFWNSTPPLPVVPIVQTFERSGVPTLFAHPFHSKSLVNARFATTLFSISSALFSSRRRGYPFISSSRQTASTNSFRMNTCKSVSKQRTLTTFRMNTYKKTRGGGQLWLTRKISVTKAAAGIGESLPRLWDELPFIGVGLGRRRSRFTLFG